MKNSFLFLPKISFNKGKLFLKILGLATVSFLNNGSLVKAAPTNCGPGNNWLESCSSSSSNFSTSVLININFASPDNQIDFSSNLFGPTQILTGNPVDAITNEPLLGNVGTFDGNLDVIQTEFFSTITGSTPFEPVITAFFGDNIADLAPTPFESSVPFLSLYSAGAIVQDSDNSALANSFFDLFFEVEGAIEGTQRNIQPLRVTSLNPLTEFPPNSEQDFQYVSTEIIPLFIAGDDGIYGTDDDIEISRLVPDENGYSVVISLNSTPVPESSTIFSSLLIGLGILCIGKKKNN